MCHKNVRDYLKKTDSLIFFNKVDYLDKLIG